MKYERPRESEKISEVLDKIFNEPKRVPEIAEELEKSESTVYKRLNALKKEELVKQENHSYSPNKDLIYNEFWNYITRSITIRDKELEKQFNSIKNTIKENQELRKHLLKFVEKELETDNTPAQQIFVKYKDRLEIRYNYIYQLANNDLSDKEIPEQKKKFWKHLQIIQALLPQAVWTETWHITELEKQIQSTELENLKDSRSKLRDKARNNIEELAAGN